MYLPSGTSGIVNFPRLSVMHPFCSSFIIMLTPSTGLPFSISETVPVTGIAFAINGSVQRERSVINLYLSRQFTVFKSAVDSKLE